MPLASPIVAVAAYLLGSIPTGYLLVRLFRHQDIRSVGSGNIGATNVLRTGGKALGAATFLLDMLKGCAAVWLGEWAAAHVLLWARPAQHRSPGRPLGRARPHVPGLAPVSAEARVWPPALASSWSPRPWQLSPPSPSFGVILALTRYVSLASILGAASFPVFAWLLVEGDRPPFFFAVQFAVALLIILKHHQNIRRLLAGTESRFGAKKPA